MSTLPAIGARQAHPGTLTNSGTDVNSASKQLASGNSATSSTSNAGSSSGGTPVSLSQSGLDLSTQGLQNVASDLGNQTIDFAQSFVSGVTQALFGDAANGATISYDSASIETEAGYAAGVQHTSGANGTTDSAGLSLNESSHFIGKGTITMADGTSYQFEVEVQYSASAEAVAGTSSPAASTASDGSADGSGTDLSSLPTLQLPAIQFPGNLSDLFKMLGNPLQTSVPATAQSDGSAGTGGVGGTGSSAGGQGGTLSLRLLNLIQHATTLGAATSSSAATSTPSAASAYATQAPSDDPNLAPPATTA